MQLRQSVCSKRDVVSMHTACGRGFREECDNCMKRLDTPSHVNCELEKRRLVMDQDGEDGAVYCDCCNQWFISREGIYSMAIHRCRKAGATSA